jgi:hypothetical protein
MAGTALLPWEKWLAQLLQPLYVAIRRWLHNRERRKSLTEAQAWPRARGTVASKKWDSSLPREEITYSYTTERGYYSGFHWHWFDRAEAREVKPGDEIELRYDPKNPERSILVSFV